MFNIYRILKQLAWVLPLLPLLGLNAAAAWSAQQPTSSWDDGESSVFTEPKSFRDYNLEKGDQIKPLPQAGRKTQADALSLSWSLHIVGGPQQDRPAEGESAPQTPVFQESTPEVDGASPPGAEFGDAFGTLLIQKSPGESLKPAVTIPASLPAWLKESPLWLFVRISSNVENSYLYAPFALGQSSREQRETAEAVIPVSLEIIDDNGEPIQGAHFYYPPGGLKEDSFSGLRLPVYQNEILALGSIPGSLLGKKLYLKINALICTATSCTPFRKSYSLQLNTADISSEILEPELLAAFMDYRTAPFGTDPADAAPGGPDVPLDASKAPDELLDNAIEQASLEGRLAAYISSLKPQYHAESLEVTNAWRAVLLGLLAGFILNFMPCVLPVISLKLGTLLGLGGWRSLEKNSPEAKRGRRRFRLYGLCFTLGVFVWFGLLFGIIGFAGMMWGQFFQSQELILGLAILLFVMALSMFGLVRIPLINVQVSGKASLPYQAFFGGLLATLLATPCSGPLLGGVLGWAVNQSTVYLGITLLAVAVGMSSPFILMVINPSLARLLPKPGPWTVTLERVMGFVLLATVLYLLSMLNQAKIFTVLAALLTLAFSAWLWARPTSPGKSRFTLGRVLALVLLVPALYFPFSQRVTDTSWQNFNADTFQTYIGQRNMLVDFTADWCINCRAMEMTTLTEERLRRWGREYDLTFVRVDLTGDNPDGTALLRAMGSASIPLLAIIPAHDPQNPVVLRDLVTPAQVDKALKQAFKRQ